MFSDVYFISQVREFLSFLNGIYIYENFRTLIVHTIDNTLKRTRHCFKLFNGSDEDCEQIYVVYTHMYTMDANPQLFKYSTL